MRVFETFTVREKKKERQGQPDVYQYSDFPQPFRVQVIHIWVAAVGPWFVVDRWVTQPDANNIWWEIHNTLAREIGVFQLGNKNRDRNPFDQCQEFLLNSPADGVRDLIEVSFVAIDQVVRKLPHSGYRTLSADGAIDELNYRLRQHNIGYEFVGGRLIKLTSEYIHANVVRPAIGLLSDARFSGAEEEFLRAHEHYRNGRNKEAINEALKAFESTMKSICAARKWAHSASATAKDLIGVLLSNGLIAPDLQSQFTALRSVLESGVPTIRNRQGGHGQGTQPTIVPGHVAAYALHLTASNIVFLVEAHKAKR